MSVQVFYSICSSAYKRKISSVVAEMLLFTATKQKKSPWNMTHNFIDAYGV